MRSRRLYLGALILMALFLTLGSGFYVMSYLLSSVIAVFILAWLWTKLSMRGISAGADDQPSLAQVGERVEESVWLDNSSLLPRPWLHIEDIGDVPGLASEVMGVPTRGSRNWTKLGTRADKRGRFHWGPLRVTASDPFGLFETTRIIGEKRELVVYPAPFPVDDFVISSAEETGDAPDYRATSQFTPNVVSVRRYTVGDSLNRIHWKSSAKLNRLMVKEFETEVQSDLAILLDLNAAVQVGEGLNGTEEVSVTVAASIARYLLEFDNGVGFSAIGDSEYTIPNGTGDRHMWRILEALALCKAEGRVSLRELLGIHEAQFSRRTGVIAITPSVEDAMAAATILQERNSPGAVILLEPTTFGASGDYTSELASFYSMGIAAYIVRLGDDISRALSFNALGPIAMQPGNRRSFTRPERWGA